MFKNIQNVVNNIMIVLLNNNTYQKLILCKHKDSFI